MVEVDVVVGVVVVDVAENITCYDENQYSPIISLHVELVVVVVGAVVVSVFVVVVVGGAGVAENHLPNELTARQIG